MKKKLSNCKVLFPIKEEQKPKVSKRILKEIDKLLEGKASHVDVESIGRAKIMGQNLYGTTEMSKHIVKIDVVENGYLSFETESSTYIVNPDEYKRELLMCLDK